VSWDDIQHSVNNCNCRGTYKAAVPERPPAPIPGVPLFLTEVPPKTGGFWCDSDPPDRLRRVLFTILGGIRPEFSTLPFDQARTRKVLAKAVPYPDSEVATRQICWLPIATDPKSYPSLRGGPPVPGDL
jgi:hypothetical protein